MKKTIIGISLLVSGLFAGQAVAQNPVAVGTTCKQKTEQCLQADCQLPAGQCAVPQAGCPFDGLNLTAEQQAKLKEITPCGNRDSKKADKEAREQARKERREAAQNSRREYLNKVKSILTPEQYTQFLENSYLNREPRHNARPVDRKGHHGSMKAKRIDGQRVQRANIQQAQQAK